MKAATARGAGVDSNDNNAQVAQISFAPEISISERQAALSQRYRPWQAMPLDVLLARVATDFPERAYVITDARTWTYRAMESWVAALAGGLSEAGVTPGEHVALLMANYPEFVALKFAISRVGAVAVPINFLNRRDELAYVLKQSNAALLITMDRFRDLDYLGMLDELNPGWPQQGGGTEFPTLRRIVVLATGTAPLPLDVVPFASLIGKRPVSVSAADPAGVADIIYTSGTTGSPKGVLLTHDALLRTAFGGAYSRAFIDGQRVLFSLPLYHVYGYVEGLLAVLMVGGAVVPRLKFEARDTLSALEGHRATDLLLIPTMTMALLDELERERYDLSSLKTLISSGGRSPPTLWRKIFAAFGDREVTTGYGMTEVTATATITRPDDPHERLQSTNGRVRQVGPAGEGAPAGLLVAYRVCDLESGRELPPGHVGELQAKGPGVTHGYYDKPDATQEAFTADGWLHTGDLGTLDVDGYLTLAGRHKESYRCGGEQVLPGEVEDLLSTHPSVLQAYVVPLPDDRMGEIGVAFIVLRTPATDPEELLGLCKARLARFKVPRHILFIGAEDVPLTPSGRPRKFLLAQRAIELLEASQ
jgi:fatty-acyl-CoA synthase